MKKLIALLLALVMVLSLVACGNAPAEDTDDTQAQAATTENKEDDTPTEKKKLVIWAQWSENENHAQAMRNAIARFEADYPEYVVEINYGGREVSKILKTSLDSGIQIDIVDGAHDFIPSQIGPDYLISLEEYMDGTEFEASFTASAAAFSKSFSPDGESWYYIPYNPFVGTVFYNKDIFAEAGVESLPTNWDEFLECCQKIRDAGYDPMTIDGAYVSLLYGHYLALMKGQDWVGDLMTDTTGEMWSDPAVQQMAEDWQEFRELGYFAPSVGSNVFPAAQNGEFAVGTAAMYFNGSWVCDEVADITGDDFNWGMMFFPAPDGAIYDYTTAENGCQMYAVTKSCENPEAAVILLSYMMSKEAQQELVDLSSAIPAVQGVTMPGKLGDLEHILNESTYTFIWEGMPKQDSEIKPLVNEAFHRLIGGELTATEFISNLQDQIGG